MLQVACGAAPQMKRFYVVIYMDAVMSRPLMIWQVYVHAMQRVDVAAVEGQTTRLTLMLRCQTLTVLTYLLAVFPLLFGLKYLVNSVG